MSRKLWIDPGDIHIVGALNNRELDIDYVQSLTESMQQNGYLPEYPVEVFPTENLDSIQVEKRYVCACGAHRTLAAMEAKIPEVLAIIHDGSEEDWIETMSLDNFKFDVVANSSLGQTFTQKEKRAACYQLLLLPKYLKMTNVALADAWNVQESTVRNWREKVVSQICEGVDLPFVSADRLAQLKAVIESPEREDAEGNTVKVRSRKSPEEIQTEKRDFMMDIREDAGWWSEGFLKDYGLNWNDVEDYFTKTFSLADGWKTLGKVSMQRLRQLHNWILSEDPEFIAGCQEIAEARKSYESVKEAVSEACDACETAIRKRFCPNVSKYSDEFSTVIAIFKMAVEEHGYKDFSVKSYHYGPDLGEMKVGVANLNAIVQAIEAEADWIQAVDKKIGRSSAANRKKIIERWMAARKEMRAAFDVYVSHTRKISWVAFCYAWDDAFREKSGYCLRLMSEKPSKRKQEQALKIDIRHFKQAAKALQENAKWIRQIPEQPKAEGAVQEVNGTALPTKSVADILGGGDVFFIKMSYHDHKSGKTEIRYFENNTTSQDGVEISNVPESVLVQLLEIARMEKSK